MLSRSSAVSLIVEDEIKLARPAPRPARGGPRGRRRLKGEDALCMATATDYDAVVLDVMLPGIDGFEVCRRLRAGTSGHRS